MTNLGSEDNGGGDVRSCGVDFEDRRAGPLPDGSTRGGLVVGRSDLRWGIVGAGTSRSDMIGGKGRVGFEG